ncbi:MAG: nucleotidyltransferase domain-containing protein [Desulfuromonadales bacterium]|nr:nucleotidyltransferase domain-containing protein [Desulfuromonadales bacterium]
MSIEDELILAKMAERIVREVNPARIVLFGSRARGDAKATSDVDLLVVEDGPFGPNKSRFHETSRINRVLSGFGIAKDVLVYSTEEVELWRNTTNHVIAHALREGRVLYDRP